MIPSDLPVAERAKLAGLLRLRESLPLAAVELLRIRDKVGMLMPLRFNRAQRFLHDTIEAQKQRTGMVRVIGLKGRQQGFSTYVGARYYHKASMNPGQRARVISHSQDSTDDLFGIINRYQENNPIGPHEGAANEKELVFDLLDSGYKVATAGSKDIGRGGTAQLLHGSEVAFWVNLSTHLAGIGNIVADLPGTEIILESTANGQGNGFHQLWQAAEKGEVPYIPVFVPWFWQPEYRAAVPPGGLNPSSEDREYQRSYELTDEQMAWRAAKIGTYEKGFEWLFDQEYPASPTVAFIASNKNPLVPPEWIDRAAKSSYREMAGPHVISCDPAGDSTRDLRSGRTVICYRRGRLAYKFTRLIGLNTMQIAGKLAEIWREVRPDALFVEKDGLGAGIVDRLAELGVPVIGVNAGSSPTDKTRYLNKRAEMWWGMREWLNDEPCRIVNEPELLSDLVGPMAVPSNSSGLRQVESKESMRKRGVRSPDYADSLALTFAEPVISATEAEIRAGATPYVPASRAGY